MTDYTLKNSPFKLGNKANTRVVPCGDGTAFLILPRIAPETALRQAGEGKPIVGRDGFEDAIQIDMSSLSKVYETGVPALDDPRVVLTSQRKQHGDRSFAQHCETAKINLGKRTKISQLSEAELLIYSKLKLSTVSRWTYHISWIDGSGDMVTRDLSRLFAGCGKRSHLLFEDYRRENLTAGNLKTGEVTEMNTEGRYAVRNLPAGGSLTVETRDLADERAKIREEIADEVRAQVKEEVKAELLIEFGELINR